MSNNENPWRGVTLYDWVSFFKEISQKLAEIGDLSASNRDQRMKELARTVFKDGAILRPEFAPINPFSFIYTLASKNAADTPVRLMDARGFFGRAKEAFGVVSAVPTDGIFPVPPAVNTLVGGSLTTPDEIDNLWSLFATVARAKNYTALSNEAFLGCVSKRGISTRNLSQCLFLINPDCYLPLDKNGFLSLCSMHPMGRKMSARQIILSIKRGDYQFHDIIEVSRNMFPGCKPYEINHFAYSYLQARVVISERYWQISSNVYDKNEDLFQSFRERSAVWIGGANEGDLAFQQPDTGDIVLVRYGRKKGHAIGIVLDNQYRRCDSYREDATISVVFLNVHDHPANLAKMTPIDRISRAHEKTISAFECTPEFRPTIAFLKKLQSNGKTGEHATQKPMTNSTLNRIFYGPPGTGKTFRTTSAALEILDPGFYAENKDHRQKLRGRFVELREDGRVEFVTFHQSFGYEEFVEGIRPVMSGKQGREIAYEITDGVFKRICEAAKHDAANRYVLIIDEINRGNISRIFGELITLIEESKRAGGSDEISVTLPYSKEVFTVPANLHIIGTMNTADRSIALLDTALRRRFKFTEMMPDSSILAKAEIVVDGVNVSAMLSAINERIEAIYDRDHQIGHTYFLELEKSKTIESLSSIFRDDILPLLQEYFYDDWEKIHVVLNDNGFVVKSDMPRMKSADSVNRDKKIWRVAGEDAFRNPGNYMKIYETQSESPQNETE